MNNPEDLNAKEPGTVNEPTSSKASAAYDRFVEMSRDIFEKGQEKSRDAWERAMELAKQQLTAAGEFGAEQGEAFKAYLRRDLDQTREDMHQLGEEAKERLNPARLGAGALSSLAKLLQATGHTLTAMSDKAEEALIYRVDEITSAGTLTCLACGHKVQLKETGVVHPCPACQGRRFRKGY